MSQMPQYLPPPAAFDFRSSAEAEAATPDTAMFPGAYITPKADESGVPVGQSVEHSGSLRLVIDPPTGPEDGADADRPTLTLTLDNGMRDPVLQDVLRRHAAAALAGDSKTLDRKAAMYNAFREVAQIKAHQKSFAPTPVRSPVNPMSPNPFDPAGGWRPPSSGHYPEPPQVPPQQSWATPPPGWGAPSPPAQPPMQAPMQAPPGWGPPAPPPGPPPGPPPMRVSLDYGRSGRFMATYDHAYIHNQFLVLVVDTARRTDYHVPPILGEQEPIEVQIDGAPAPVRAFSVGFVFPYDTLMFCLLLIDR